MNKEKTFVEKKLRGSGGYAIAKVSDDEQKRANLGGPELFLAGVGKLDNDRFKKYYCNKCEKEYQGAPNLEFENPNEDLGENIILKEKGEYKCKNCDYIIAQYRKFDESKDNATLESKDQNEKEKENGNKSYDEVVETENKNESNNKSSINPINSINPTENSDNDKAIPDLKSTYVHIEKIIGMSAYDNNAHLIGNVQEIGLRKLLEGKVEFSFKIKSSNNEIREIEWNETSKIGDIIILAADQSSQDNENKSRGLEAGIGNVSSSNNNSNNSNNSNSNMNINSSSPATKLDTKICKNCKSHNEAESIFCEECGKKLE
jgi:sporulation protein YlmC with PRC-barrel domain